MCSIEKEALVGFLTILKTIHGINLFWIVLELTKQRDSVGIETHTCLATNNIITSLASWPCVHKAFQNQYQDQAKVKQLFTMAFFSKPTITIDCWQLIEYLLQTRLLRFLSFFMKGKLNVIVATVINIWAH